MKLILAIVSSDDSSMVSSALTKNNFSVTKLATTGGFLMSGNTTFLIGTEDENVDKAINVIGEHSKKRKQMVPSSASYGVGMYTSFPVEVTVGGATIFVLDVEQFKKLEQKLIPQELNYEEIPSLRLEARQKLSKVRPRSVGQASRISGVSPADVNVLLVYLEQYRLCKK